MKGNAQSKRAARRRQARLRRKQENAQSGRIADTRPGGIVRALTASAMALPGMAPQALASDGPVEGTSGSFAYSFYAEDNLRPSRSIAGGERSRMEIGSYQFRLTTPLGERADLEVEGGYETLSGASPWFILDIADPNNPGQNKLVQVMSEATIDEQRGDLLATASYYYDWGNVSATTGFSVENDYYSVNFGVGAERDFNDKNTTLSGGLSFSLDWIEPTQDRVDSGRINKDDKQSFSLFAGVSQILTRHSAIQSTFTYDFSTGYLSDPYKLVTVAGSALRDDRPDERNGFTWLTRYRHHLSALEGTVHADYKLYVDDWSMTSHTFDFAYYQSLLPELLPANVQLIPSFRYYSQGQASFYSPVFGQTRSDGHYSSDYRLSPYGAISYGLKAQISVEDGFFGMDWVGALSYERYESKAKWAIQSVDVRNPGLVAFRLYSATLTAKF